MKAGTKVAFRPSHQKEMQLTGKVVSVDGNSVVVESDATSGNIARVYDVHLEDVIPLKEAEEVHKTEYVRKDEPEAIDHAHKRKASKAS